MKKLRKYLFEVTLVTVALILFSYALLKEPPVSGENGDPLAFWAFCSGIGLILIALFGKRTFSFFTINKNYVQEIEDPTQDSFISQEEWKEFVSDGCH